MLLWDPKRKDEQECAEMNRLFCDRCKKEMNVGVFDKVFRVVMTFPFFYNNSFELCKNCGRIFKKFMKDVRK